MRGRHGAQYVAQCVACAALTLFVWQEFTNLTADKRPGAGVRAEVHRQVAFRPERAAALETPSRGRPLLNAEVPDQLTLLEDRAPPDLLENARRKLLRTVSHGFAHLLREQRRFT